MKKLEELPRLILRGVTAEDLVRIRGGVSVARNGITIETTVSAGQVGASAQSSQNGNDGGYNTA